MYSLSTPTYTGFNTVSITNADYLPYKNYCTTNYQPYLADRAYPPITGDFDGDGATDIIHTLATGVTYSGGTYNPSCNCYNITSSVGQRKAFISFPAKGEYYKPLTDDDVYLIGGAVIDNSKDVTGTADFNGDGNDEIFLRNRFGIISVIKNSSGLYQLLPRYVQLSGENYNNADINKEFIGDFNGDGRADILKKNDNNPFYIYYSTGGGTSANLNNGGFYAPLFPMNAATILTFNNTTDYLNTKVLTADFNGDGKCDVVFQNLDVTNNKSVLDIYYSNGISFTYAGKKETTNSTKYIPDLVGDFDGDGAFEILNKSKNTHSYHGSSYLLLDFGNQQKERLLKKVKDGFNRKIEFDYKSLTEGDYTFYDNGDGPQQIPATVISGLKTSMHVVSSVNLPDGVGSYYELNYSYGSAYFHREGKGFLGFTRITEKNTLTNIFTETSSSPLLLDPVNKVYTACMPYNIKQYQFGGLQISDKSFTNSVELLSNKRIKIVTNQVDSKDYVNGSNSLTTLQYDAYSNPTQITTSVNGGQQTTTTTIPALDYVPVLAGLPPSLPKNISTNITRNGIQFTQATNIAYDANGRPLTEVQNYQSATKPLTVTYEYDAFGNVKKTNYSGFTAYFGGASTINVNATTPYLSNGRFLQSYKVPEKNDISILDIDKKWGTPVSIQDNNNNKITTFEYDGFGKNKKITPPTPENSIAFGITTDYTFSTTYNSMYKITNTVTGQSSSTEYYDAFGRLVRSEETTDGKLKFTENTYDAKGDIITVKTTDANGGTITTTNTYDNFHRLLTSNTPLLSMTTTNTYTSNTGVGFTINSAITGQPTKITKYDGTGNITEVSESADGQTTVNSYTYHPTGSILSITQGGNTLISCEYDENGNQTKLTDVDAGVNEYTYDAFGNVLTQKDARNNTIDNSYDINGRLVIKIQALNGASNMKLTGYQYKTFYSNGGGNLEHIVYNDLDNASNSITEDYQYDTDDRVKQITKNFEGVNYISKYEYGNYGRVASITYPSVTNTPLKVNYATITSDGLVTNINAQNNGGTPKTIYTISAANYNHFGQPKSFTIGGLLTGTRVYNILGLPTQIKTNQSIVTWQDINTTWNLATGNLTRRWELSPMQNATNRDESFTYDGFNRLTKVTNGTQQYEISYDNIGRMNKKFDAGSEYKYQPAKLHALKTIKAGVGYTAPQPDDRTDISQSLQIITYNELNQPDLITEGTGTSLIKKTKFIYDIDGNRIKTTYTEENASGVVDAMKTVHRYFLGGYEYERNSAGNVVRELSYINTPAGLAAIFYKEPTGSDYYLTCTDHLGSITNALASTNTLVNFKQSFDAWGRYRQPGNWQSYTVTDPPHPAMYRGFTGHEMLPKFDLINMNGRLYDPKVGQMLSPDNNVGDAFSTQHYNRYSYVWNNPLKYIDPSGEDGVLSGSSYWRSIFFGNNSGYFGAGTGASETFSYGTYSEGGISSSGAFSYQGSSGSSGGSNLANQLASTGSSILGGMIIQGIVQFANAMEQHVNGTSDPLTKFQIQQIANNNTISIYNSANRNATNGNGCSRSYSILSNNNSNIVKSRQTFLRVTGSTIEDGILFGAISSSLADNMEMPSGIKNAFRHLFSYTSYIFGGQTITRVAEMAKEHEPKNPIIPDDYADLENNKLVFGEYFNKLNFEGMVFRSYYVYTSYILYLMYDIGFYIPNPMNPKKPIKVKLPKDAPKKYYNKLRHKKAKK